jgi:hypothetical protein
MSDITKGLHKIVLQDSVRICRFLLEKGDTIYVIPTDDLRIKFVVIPLD